jgi:hypothetical protein
MREYEDESLLALPFSALRTAWPAVAQAASSENQTPPSDIWQES